MPSTIWKRIYCALPLTLTLTPAEIPNDVFDALRPHFTPQQLVELTSAIAWENYRARFNRAFAVEAAGYAEGSVCAMPAQVGGA